MTMMMFESFINGEAASGRGVLGLVSWEKGGGAQHEGRGHSDTAVSKQKREGIRQEDCDEGEGLCYLCELQPFS